MHRAVTLSFLLATAMASAPARCQDGSEWDRARAQLAASQRGTMSASIEQWRQLSGSGGRLSFSEYSGFLITYPGFPDEDKIKAYAERALEREVPDRGRILAYFDRVAPLTNPAKAQYALALASAGRPEAKSVALEAWRGGEMSEAAYAGLFSLFGGSFTPDDQDARMDALLWAGALPQAQGQLNYVSAARRDAFMARLAMLQGQDPASLSIPVTPDVLKDTGYIYQRARQLRQSGSLWSAVNLLATRPAAIHPPQDPTKWVAELLFEARAAGAEPAVQIASKIDDGFAPGTDVSRLEYKLRDDYTSLMWLGGTKALDSLGDGVRAAPLFYRYGAAARTPQTRSKGFYWAGRALAKSGDRAGAARYFEMAAAYPDQFYGLLALERLGRPLPDLARQNMTVPTAAERAEFAARPLTRAVREVSRDYDWKTSVRFFREIADRAETESDHVLVAELARSLGRRDLGVILGQAAHADGFGNFRQISFPQIPTPPGTNWTVVHMITRQESQFAQNAISHAGARGLMQLMPGTAREQAGKIGLSYNIGSLIYDANYNIRLGDSFFGRMMDYYGGSYPLAVAAYNAGPGNVNRWLRDNGDPRLGGIEWVDWIERIPIYETRNYVQRVLENAVVYERLYPDKASYRGANPLSHFLGKRSPG
ncbi:MAG: lytic transglycosylase domain-containing protein [Novosphingobium sp.]